MLCAGSAGCGAFGRGSVVSPALGSRHGPFVRSSSSAADRRGRRRVRPARAAGASLVRRALGRTMRRRPGP